MVDDPAVLDGIVSAKDPYDLRDELDPPAMRAETRLHHLLDAENLDSKVSEDGDITIFRNGEMTATLLGR